MLVVLRLSSPSDRRMSLGTLQTAKVYVQTLIEEHGDEVFDAVFRRDGSVVIAGSAKRMPADVTAAIQKVCVTQRVMLQLPLFVVRFGLLV
jgi:sulfite reductase alpha subunit-like flavoprotein